MKTSLEYMRVNERESGGKGAVARSTADVGKLEELKYLVSIVQSNRECAREVR